MAVAASYPDHARQGRSGLSRGADVKRQPVELRQAAQRDIDEAIDFYVAQEAHEAAPQ